MSTIHRLHPIGRATLAALAGLSVLPGLAQAQAAPAGELQTVVVSAQKREQSAQQVGVAISVLSGDELAERGVKKVNQLQNEVPGLEIEPAFGGGQAQFRLRGIGFQDYATNNAGAVTVYVDEVALPLPVQTQGLLFDLSRVEVLRGPQGTLYGRNTTGGAVNFITRGPTKKFEAGVTLGFGSYGATEAEAYLSGPLSDALRGRIAVATQQGGAWQFNRDTGEKLGAKHLTGLRGQLELDATRDLKLAFSVHAGRDTSDGQGLYAFVGQPAVPAYPVPKAALPADTNPRATGWGFASDFLSRLGYSANAKPSRDNQSHGGALRADWTGNGLKLTSITSADWFSRRELADYDATSLPLAETYFGSKARNVSQELRVASNTPDAPLNWLAGLYWADEKLDEQYASSFLNSIRFPGITFANVLTSYSQKARTVSVFGQADWKLSPELKLVAGLRQEHERRERLNFATRTINPDVPFYGPTNGSFANSQTSGKLALEYQARRDLLAYGSLSRGVKSGGFTAYNTTNEVALNPFKPEVLVAYEAGIKAEPTRQLRINGAVYHYDYRNQQILDAATDPVSGTPIGKIINAPKSEINGIEFDVTFKPDAAWTLAGFAGYKDGKFKQYTAILPPADLSGQGLYFPRLNGGASASWQTVLGGWQLLTQADVSYHDKSRTFLNRINPSYDFATPAYWLANARVELAPVDAKWRATFYVRNLANKHYDVTRNFFLPELPVAAAGEPRTVGVRVHYDF